MVTCGWFVVQRLRSPEVVQSMERGIEAIHARFEPITIPQPYPSLNAVSLDKE